MAVVGFSRSAKADLEWGKGVEVVLIPQFFRLIADDLRKLEPAKEAVPEGFPILRAIQFTLAFAGMADPLVLKGGTENLDDSTRPMPPKKPNAD